MFIVRVLLSCRSWRGGGGPPAPPFAVGGGGGGGPRPPRLVQKGGLVERLAEVFDRLPDRGLGGVGAAEVVDHHEVVDDPLVPGGGYVDAGLPEFARVGLALVAQHVRLGGDHEGLREPGELLG